MHYQELMVMTNAELIEARDVAEVLQISIPSLRDYRKRGLIVVAAKRGNTDLYDKADVVRRCSIIKEKRGQGFSLTQISQLLLKEQSNVVNVSGPQEPSPDMNDQELLHGFLTDLYRKATPETKADVEALCRKWNVRFQESGE
jgi:DNA-binding transcriptional MerR regulator